MLVPRRESSPIHMYRKAQPKARGLARTLVLIVEKALYSCSSRCAWFKMKLDLADFSKRYMYQDVDVYERIVPVTSRATSTCHGSHALKAHDHTRSLLSRSILQRAGPRSTHSFESRINGIEMSRALTRCRHTHRSIRADAPDVAAPRVGVAMVCRRY